MAKLNRTSDSCSQAFTQKNAIAREMREYASRRSPIVVPNGLPFCDSKPPPESLALVVTIPRTQTSNDVIVCAGLTATLYCAKERSLVRFEMVQRRSKMPLSASSPKRSIIPYMRLALVQVLILI